MDSSKDDARPSTSFARESPQIQDDDSERVREQRRSMVMALLPMNRLSMDGQIMVRPEEIINHIDICMKMFFENKINVHNAWNMKIIDYLARYLQLRKDNRDTLQVGGMSLEVGAKVYSIRVDDVHSTGLKLASSISKIAHRNRKEPDNEDAEEIKELNPPKKTGAIKKKKKFVPGGPKNTIAKDINTLLQDVQKLDSAVFKTKTNSDLSMVDNFLTSKIPIDKSGCAFVFMSREKESLWVSEEDTDHTLVDKQYPFKLPAMKKFNLCREYEDFEVDEWDPDNEEGNDVDFTFNTEVILDDEGIPIHDLSGPIDDVFVDNDSDDTDSDGEAVMREVTKVVDLRPSTSTEPDDYCFKSISSISKCNIFMGPSHWKYKYLKPAESHFSGKDDKKVVKRRKPKKEPVEIDFFNGTPIALESPNSRVRTTLKPWPVTNRYTFPNSECLTRVWNVMNLLFLKPKNLDELRGEVVVTSSGSNNDELVPYEYDNPNDSSYCSQNNDGDDNDNADYNSDVVDNDDNNSDDGDNAENIVYAEELPREGQSKAYVGENLIAPPEMVQTNFVNYKTKSKKMDMKKLKEKMWSIMVDEADSNLRGEKLFQKKIEKPVTFRDVYKTLPSKLNPSMKENLSSPLAFVALLHLANEQNLKLTQQADLKNFRIEQDKDDLA